MESENHIVCNEKCQGCQLRISYNDLYKVEELEENNKYFDNENYCYLNYSNLNKYIQYTDSWNCINQNNIKELRDKLLLNFIPSYLYEHKEVTDKYYSVLFYMKDYYVKRSARFEELCEIQPEYKNFINDIENYFREYLIDSNFMKRLFSSTSIIFNLIKNYSYNDTLNIFIQRIIIDEVAIPMKNIRIENIDSIDLTIVYQTYDLSLQKIEIIDSVESGKSSNNSIYKMWISTSYFDDSNDIEEENVDNDYILDNNEDDFFELDDEEVESFD